MPPSMKIVIVGGGVSGFSCGVNILKMLPNVEVTLVSDVFTPDTTGDGAAGLCVPVLLAETPTERVAKWFLSTINYCKTLLLSGEASNAGVFSHSGYVLDYTDFTSKFKDIYLTFEKISAAKMQSIIPSCQREGIFLTTIVIEGKQFIPWLMKKYSQLGGKIERRRVESLEQFVGRYDMVVNCTGIGAKRLVNDDNVFPIRGQVIKVKAPFVKHFYTDLDNIMYIIPGAEIVTIGGTYDKGNYDCNVDEVIKKRIMDHACGVLPSIKHCTVLSDWVGLRPGRRSVRLELETMQFHGKHIPVIHNYGHGGGGLTLSWGCAENVVDLIKQEARLHAKL